MIYFYLPEIANKPFGGVRTIFDYIQRINELSGSKIAVILSNSKYLFNFLPKQYNDVQVFPLSHKIGNEDLLIVPEISPEIAQKYPQNPKMLAVLNWEYFNSHVNIDELKSLNYKAILTNSNFSADYLKNKKTGLPIFHISHLIDTKTYFPKINVNKRSKNSIFIFNRKNTHHLPVIIEFLKDFDHNITLVNNIHPDKLSDLYNNHQVFINLGYPEGFCRPIAEAMACGCLVVGFSGGGAKDFAIDGINSFIAPDGDEKKLLEKLNTVLNLSEAEKNQISKSARYMINKNYSKIKQALAIYQAFTEYIPGKYTNQQIKILYSKDEMNARKSLSNKPSILNTRRNKIKNLQEQLFQVRLEKMQIQKGYITEKGMNQKITSSMLYKLYRNVSNIKENLAPLYNFSFNSN